VEREESSLTRKKKLDIRDTEKDVQHWGFLKMVLGGSGSRLSQG